METTTSRTMRPRHPVLLSLPANNRGRDFIVGDLHGMRGLLDQELARVGFLPGKGDRLISVGDLVDRGPDPMGCLRLLGEPWFHAVLGNHERILLASLGYHERLLMKIQGLYYSRWTRSLSPGERHELIHGILPRLLTLPLALRVGDGPGRYYVVHAGRALGKGMIDDATLERAHEGSEGTGKPWVEALTWSRRMAHEAMRGGARKGGHGAWEDGVSLTYAGHTVIQQPLLHRSHIFLDRGGERTRRKTPRNETFELLLWEHGRLPPAAPHHEKPQAPR